MGPVLRWLGLGCLAALGMAQAAEDIATFARQLAEQERARWQVTEGQPQYEILVFISEGMPDGELRALFAQAAAEPRGQVRFVLRGFTPQQLGPLIGRLRARFPDPEADHIWIDIDPELFTRYQVDAVPVFLVRHGEQWFEVRGAMSLDEARQRTRTPGPLVAGPLYEITEPDLLAVIAERLQQYDWERAFQRARARLAGNLSRTGDLPTATQDRVAYFTPTWTVPEDIYAPGDAEGQTQVLLARAGTVIRLLEHTRLQVPIIVFDADDPRQEDIARRWLAEYPQADVFIVGGQPQGERPAPLVIAERLGRPVYPWFDRYSDRFGVEAVPALIDQPDSQRLRIRYVAPKAVSSR